MSKILYINGAMETKISASAHVLKSYFSENSDKINLIERNLISNPPPYYDNISYETLCLFQDKLSQQHLDRKKFSNDCIDEIKNSDKIVIRLSIYNYSISAQLKSWIDHVYIYGVTFGVDENNEKINFNDKPILILVSSMTDIKNTQENFSTSYLKFIFNRLGFNNIKFIYIESCFEENYIEMCKNTLNSIRASNFL